MNKQYLINQIELFCKEYDLNPSDVYETLGILFNSVHGYNIVEEMHNKHLYDMPEYLENKGPGFIEYYIECLNMLRNNLSNKDKNIINKEYIFSFADQYADKQIRTAVKKSKSCFLNKNKL